MAVKVEIPYSKTIESPKSVDEVFQIISEEDHIPKCFPGVESFKNEGGHYRWEFEKVSFSGYDFQFKLLTKFIAEKPKIKIEGIPHKDYALIHGGWKVEPKNSGSALTFDVKLEMELPVPFFLKSVATPLTQKEITKLFDRYLHNVSKALTT